MAEEKDLVVGDNSIVESFVPATCKMLHNNNAGLCSQNAYVIVDTYFLDRYLISSVTDLWMKQGVSIRLKMVQCLAYSIRK